MCYNERNKNMVIDDKDVVENRCRCKENNILGELLSGGIGR